MESVLGAHARCPLSSPLRRTHSLAPTAACLTTGLTARDTRYCNVGGWELRQRVGAMWRRDVAEMMAQQNGTQYKAMQHKYSILVESSQDAHEMLSASVKELKATVHSLENKLQKVRSLR